MPQASVSNLVYVFQTELSLSETALRPFAFSSESPAASFRTETFQNLKPNSQNKSASALQEKLLLADRGRLRVVKGLLGSTETADDEWNSGVTVQEVILFK